MNRPDAARRGDRGGIAVAAIPMGAPLMIRRGRGKHGDGRLAGAYGRGGIFQYRHMAGNDNGNPDVSRLPVGVPLLYMVWIAIGPYRPMTKLRRNGAVWYGFGRHLNRVNPCRVSDPAILGPISGCAEIAWSRLVSQR